jgi:NADH:ubiquinone oxidoreductase subunit 5 (subunit L)/multisubunit Na+/H+ antiporter MnhA subunit
MVYQGLINNLQLTTYQLRLASALCLVAAMFGSGLTLASFLKLIHAAFLGRSKNDKKSTVNEVHWTMWLPCLLLAIICVLFGIFAQALPLKYFILPAVKGVSFMGKWYAGLSTLLILIGLVLGLLLFKLKGLRPNMRQDLAFVGSETYDLEDSRVTGTEFYNTIKELGLLCAIYKRAEAGVFDIYEQGKKFIFYVSGAFQYLHNGILSTYLVWCLLGILGLFYIIYF